MICRLAFLVALASCGRVGFDEATPPPGSDASPIDGGTNLPDGPAVSCPMGACACNSDCDITCGVPPCNITCTAGATCNIRCDSGPCEIECTDGAICNFTCATGGCSISVSDGAEVTGTCTTGCNIDCDVSAQSCQQTCTVPLSCQCIGSDCI